MTTNPDVFLAILAMNSYNRGYNAGLASLSDTPGAKTSGINHNWHVNT